ncbi:unnamed protein product [Clavelina lepadiformis]|uniref:Uncharacterized protein n=1 Tax=Clavelina lepadiformis TaxID=159417 RepID=A0ABP0GVR8_CLALP
MFSVLRRLRTLFYVVITTRMDTSFSRTFSAADYAVFAVMLFLSTVIGFYYAFKDRKRQNTEDYLLAGRSMSPYPVALSLCVSFLSAVTVLGTPAEVYAYGTMYTWSFVGYFTAAVITAEIYIPVFYSAKLSSVYQYLEYRFHRGIRILVTLIYMVQTVLYAGIVIYAPALALNAVTGLNLWAAAVSTGAICIIYSTLGGLKAVIWTDVLQAVVIVVGLVAVIIKSSVNAGGIENLWRNAEEGGRIDFLKFDTDPRIRHSVWTVGVGSIFLNMALYATNQAQVQRYLSCRSLKDAKKSVMFNFLGIFVINSLALLAGVALYGYYHNCDPITLGHVKRGDQLMPYFVLDLFRHNPGMPGLFVASVYSGSLSTVSTAITAMASVTLQDFLKPILSWKGLTFKEMTYTWISKGLVVFYGLICILFAYLTSQLGGILQASISVLGLAGAPLLTVFTLGVLFPCCNTWGALAGIISASTATVWVFVGRIIYPPEAEFNNRLSLSDSACLVSENTTLELMQNSTQVMENVTTAPRPPIADFYSMSYFYLTAFGFLVGITVALIVSFMTCGHRNRKNVSAKLIHPIFDHALFSCLPDRFRKLMWCGVAHDEKKKQNNNNNQRRDEEIVLNMRDTSLQ